VEAILVEICRVLAFAHVQLSKKFERKIEFLPHFTHLLTEVAIFDGLLNGKFSLTTSIGPDENITTEPLNQSRR